MIDLANETVIALADAPAHLPKRRGGKRAHVATIYRWATRGCRGVTLETLCVGGTRCTSIEALQRFCEAITAGTTQSTPSVRTSAARSRDIAAAEKELAREGI